MFDVHLIKFCFEIVLVDFILQLSWTIENMDIFLNIVFVCVY